eukprot:Skav200897  [mRNA]  locus=scaffold1581:175126:176328:+ [translate_table: standard]
MSRVNTIVSALDKNPEVQEPKIWGDLRHARSIWGMASLQTTPTNMPQWFGGTTDSAEPAPVANGQVKPKYPFFKCD